MTTLARTGKQAGFSLIELMVSLTIGLFILAGLVGVLSVNSSSSRSNDGAAELMTGARYAMNTMKQEVRQAGFRGYTWADPTAPGALGSLAGECLEAGAAAGTFLSNIRQGIWGANDSNPFSANCIPTASYAANNDVLVVRRVAAIATAAASLAVNTLYFHSTFAGGQLFRATSSPVTAPTAAPFVAAPIPLDSFAVQTHVYYISPFTVSATENPLVPALFRVALASDGSMARELVASGIERMQVQYGQVVTGATSTTAYVDTLAGSSSATAATDWEGVNSVRIWLLARAALPEPGYSNANTYTMGDQSYTVADSFRRQLLTAVVQLRN